MIDTLYSLLWRHAILYEECYGLSARTENIENSLHMTDNIWRHGPLGNCSCFIYERKVKHYKQQTTNSRVMCKTFADIQQGGSAAFYINLSTDTSFRM